MEIEEGLDGETFFLYIFLAALVVLLLVLGQHLLSSYGGRKGPRKQVIERGTSQSDDVDFEWIPKETLANIMSKLNYYCFDTQIFTSFISLTYISYRAFVSFLQKNHRKRAQRVQRAPDNERTRHRRDLSPTKYLTNLNKLNLWLPEENTPF